MQQARFGVSECIPEERFEGLLQIAREVGRESSPIERAREILRLPQAP
jgi:hypothetical protein